MKKILALLVLFASTSALAEGGGDRTYERMKYKESSSYTTPSN